MNDSRKESEREFMERVDEAAKWLSAPEYKEYRSLIVRVKDKSYVVKPVVDAYQYWIDMIASTCVQSPNLRPDVRLAYEGLMGRLTGGMVRGC